MPHEFFCVYLVFHWGDIVKKCCRSRRFKKKIKVGVEGGGGGGCGDYHIGDLPIEWGGGVKPSARYE